MSIFIKPGLWISAKLGRAGWLDLSQLIKSSTPASTYKVYTAIINQTGSNAPVATVLENTIGNIVWTRNSAGIYFGTLAGAFPNNKTVFPMWHNIGVFFSGGNLTTFGVDRIDDNTIQINTRTGITNQDSWLAKEFFEVRVYN